MLTYVFQMMLCSAIMYGYYHLFMRNERFHQYNRFYLLSTMVLSLLLPLIKIPVNVQGDDIIYQSLDSWDSAITVVVQKSPQFLTTSTLLSIIYLVVAMVFMARIAFSLRKIILLKKNNPANEMNGVSFIQTSHPDTPFSFFKWLFWNKGINLNSNKGRHIFRHEMYHIEKKHSWDLVFAEVITALLWFNPIFFLIRREIKIIQEFLADQYATSEENVGAYAETLLLQTFGTNHQQLVNPFFHNQLKRRIAMLTKSKKPAYQYLRKLMVLPLVAVATLLFAFTYNKEMSAVRQSIEHTIYPLDKITTPAPIVIEQTREIHAKDTVPKKNTKKATNKLKYDTERFPFYTMDPVRLVSYSKNSEMPKSFRNRVDIEASFPGGISAWKDYLGRNTKAGIAAENGARPNLYRVAIKFAVEPDGKLSDFQAISNEGFGMEEEAIRVLKNAPAWKPALNNKSGETKAVKVYRTQIFEFEVLALEKFAKQEKVITDATISNVPKKINEEIFTKVEKDAAYPGGPMAWRNFLERNLKGETPVDKGASPGDYTIIIQFVVDQEGNVSGLKPLTKLGHGMEEEAMRVIRSSGKWIPANQNGRDVKAYRKQPITFHVLEQKKQVSKENPK